MKKIISYLIFILVSSFTFAQTDGIRKEISKIIKGKRAIIGVALYDVQTGKTLNINGDKHFPMQSVFKFPIALKVLAEVDKGKMGLNDSIFITAKDLLPRTWSPIRDNYPEGNIKMPLSEIVRYMISQSDNNGCDILLHLLGGTSEVNNYLSSLGITEMKIKKTEAEQHLTPSAQFDNWTTPTCAIQLLKLFQEKKILSTDSRNFLWKTMTETSTGSVKSQIPQDVIVAHKTGSAFFPGSNVVNDIGVMQMPDNRTILYAIFIMNSKESKEANYQVIADIAKVVYQQITSEILK
jgi:beta-lactamase class A